MTVLTLPEEERPETYLLEIYFDEQFSDEKSISITFVGYNQFFLDLIDLEIISADSQKKGTSPLRPKIKFGLC